MSGPSPVIRICSRRNVIMGPTLKVAVSLNIWKKMNLQGAHTVLE